VSSEHAVSKPNARRGPSIVLLLLGANAFVLALPFSAFFVWRAYDFFLLRHTERQLITQSVVIAEAYREAWWAEAGVSGGEPRPPGREQERFVPIEPLIDLDSDIGTFEELDHMPLAPGEDTPERRAAARIEPLLQRSQIFNLSGVRVLDAKGCVVATTGGQANRCVYPLPEVQAALAGQYASTVRKRLPPEPLPPLGDIRLRGSLQVFTALPVFSQGRLIGVITASRTGLDALSSLWQIRRGLLVAIAVAFGMAIVISLVFARAIAGPMHSITRKAKAIANGDPLGDFVPRGFTPAEIRTLSEALDVMTKKLREQADYVADFATTVSHELKTPIAAIRGATELLQDWENMEPGQRARFLKNIELDAERMEQLVTRLLTLAKIESAAALPSGSVNVEAFCRKLLARYGSKVELRLLNPPSDIDIAQEHLAAAIGNLVDNAVRHGRGVPVVVELGSEDGRLAVNVADQGTGISPANQKKVWERFFTTERDRGGTGLGLSIVQAIAQARKGSVGFETSPNGTRFRLVL
jgi:signal transduction histidine kinase